MTYDVYLRSKEWQRKRSERLKLDNYKCQKCGSPFNLQVHHLNYRNIYNEDVKTDLITLCKRCHELIEQAKNDPKRTNKSSHATLIQDFIKTNSQKDYCNGGNLDLCNLNIVKPMLFDYLRERGDYFDSGSSHVIRHFRNARYKVILSFIEKGYPKEICLQQTNFSCGMISKVYGNPDAARNLIKEN